MINNRSDKLFKIFWNERAPWLFLAVLLPFLWSCEKDLTLELPEGEAKIVVEGHIEQDAPPVVVLTRSVPIFSGYSPKDIEAAFVHNAEVFVSDGATEYQLQEVNSNMLTPELSKLIAEQYGLQPNTESGRLPFTFYFYTNLQLLGQTGKNYKLRAQAEGQTLTANTSIPHLLPIDSLWVKPHADPKKDSLVMLWYRYRDPDTVGNSVRYFTKRNQEAFYPGYYSSIFNDELINGQPYIDFPLARGQSKGREPDFETYGYFRKGDTITVKWCAIDVPHFNFWYSLENDFNSRGNPFGAPVSIQSNIKGGLGIWGGYGVTYHRFIVPK
jgi:hypothetical protein